MSKVYVEIYKEVELKYYAIIFKWEKKWKKLQKQIKQWQGAWRNKDFFDNINNSTHLPLKLSGHVFSNGLRSVMKVRSSMTSFISPTKCPKSSLNILQSNFFSSITTITQEISKRELNLLQGRNLSLGETCKLDEELSNEMYKRVPLAVRDSISLPTECEIYTAFLTIKGRILIYYNKSEYYIVFISSNKTQEEDDERVMFNYDYDKPITKKWKVRNIRGLLKKYIVDKESALEIVIKDKSKLLNFNTKEACDAFYSKLCKLQSILPANMDKSLVDDWVNRKLSTFDYIMLLNQFAGRSFNNSSQYPVYPWVIVSASEGLNIEDSTVYRDLGKNMGMLGDKDRAENFKKRFDKITIPALGNFHFAAHYSSPAIVFQYFMRLFPFIEAYIQLFSGLDNPNRMFHSVQESLEISRNDPSDIKELVPEFFSLPEIFLNHELLQFGQREADNQTVDDVVLPLWAKGSAYKYIEIMRIALESDYVSSTINRWIDLIFGYKQRGREAKKAFNVYTTLTLEASKVLEQVKEEEKKAFRTQAYQWGQTPLQLFTKAHPSRTIKNNEVVYSLLDGNATPNVYEYKKSKNDQVIGIFEVGSTVKDVNLILVTLGGTIIEFTIEISINSESTPSFSTVQELHYNNSYYDSDIQLLDTSIDKNFPIVLVRGAYIVQGGYIDGNIQFTLLENVKKSWKMKVHGSTVTCLKVDKTEKLALTGSSSGELTLYEIRDDMRWEIKKYMCDHEGSITDIYISNDMLLFCSAGTDGIINLYTYSGNILRTFKEPRNASIQNVRTNNN